MPLKIGQNEYKYGLLLAPMAGVTDRAYRHSCRRCGAEMVYTEMVSAKALCYNDKSSYELARIDEKDGSAALQLFCHEPAVISEAIKRIFYTAAENSILPSVIDINMGCPVKKIVMNGDGSALMNDAVLAGSIAEAAVKASPVPVTVKIRTGWDSRTVNAPEFAYCMQESGVTAITVHGRTREQMYALPIDMETIAAVKRKLKIPVIGNGGISTAEDAVKMLQVTGCDGLMLARGTMGNPWLFEEIKSVIDGKEYFPPSLSERIRFAMDQVHEMVSDKGEHIGVLEARRQFSYYIKGKRGSSEIRGRLNSVTSIAEIEEIAENYISYWGR